ncbi:hypothetical protein [Draconibacterium orientale]|uniref:hypothetical protein n=1 Tax=Draconibacterium orientale TaxID=1168034 RepID=UPI002ABD4713|nr:hypothetical protein [Draconibacterium orientale]
MMKRTDKFEPYSENEHPVFMDFQTFKKKERNLHSEEHFVVPWELNHNEEKFSAKAKAWE